MSNMNYARRALVAVAASVCFLASGGGVRAAVAQESGDTLLVSTRWLSERLNEPGLAILHMGAAGDGYDDAHIPGARFMSHMDIAENVDGVRYELPPVARLVSLLESAGVSEGDRIILYGHPLYAGRMFFTLDYLGHRGRVSILDGGLDKWVEEELPLSGDHPSVIGVEYVARVRSQVVVDAAWSLDHLDDAKHSFFDARPEDQYESGHLPGAGNLHHMNTLTESSVLKDPEALRQLFNDAGLSPGDTVVTYCAIGMRASFLYFVARYLGYEVKMYDGSFTEWSGLGNLPVAVGR